LTDSQGIFRPEFPRDSTSAIIQYLADPKGPWSTTRMIH